MVLLQQVNSLIRGYPRHGTMGRDGVVPRERDREGRIPLKESPRDVQKAAKATRGLVRAAHETARKGSPERVHGGPGSLMSQQTPRRTGGRLRQSFSVLEPQSAWAEGTFSSTHTAYKHNPEGSDCCQVTWLWPRTELMNIHRNTKMLSTQLNHSIWRPAKIAKHAKEQENRNHDRGEKQIYQSKPRNDTVREF